MVAKLHSVFPSFLFMGLVFRGIHEKKSELKNKKEIIY